MKFWLIVLGLFIVVGVGSFIFFANFHKAENLTVAQKEKALENLLGRTPRLADKQPLTWEMHTGHFLHVAYPKGANVYPISKPTEIVLDNFSYSLADEFILVSAIVKATSSTTVSDDSAVQLRMATSDYTVASTSPNPSCKVFIKGGEDPEESMFCLNNGRIGSLVVTGKNSENVDKYFSVLSTSFQW